MFRKLSVILLTVLAAVLLSSAALAADSGTEDNYTWEISDKTLTLTWTASEPGPMPEDGFPWKNGDSYGSVTSVVIGEGFTSVAYQAFFRNEMIVSVQLPQTLTEIKKYAFYYCKALKSVTVPPKCKFIGKCAFDYCISLESVDFPENTDLTIEEFAFEDCTALKSVRILSGKDIVIGNTAFANCKDLTSVVIEGESCTLRDNAFQSCGSLLSATVTGNSVSMGKAVFSWGENLETVKVSLSSATQFIYQDFAKCSSLQKLYVQVVDDTAAGWDKSCDLPENTRIIVQPNSKLGLMREKWSAVADQITGIYQLKAQPCDNAVITLQETDVLNWQQVYIDVQADPGYEVLSVTYDNGEGEKPAHLPSGSSYYQFNTGDPTVDVINIRVEVQKALSVVKSEAVIELKARAGSNPSEAVAAVLEQYLAQIDAAETADEADQLLQAGRDEIAAQQAQEKQRQALEERKTDAVRTLKLFAGDTPSEAVQAVVDQYVAKISAAETVDGVDQLLQAGKNEIDALQALEERKTEAVRMLKLCAGDEPGEAILKIVEEYAAKISAAGTADEADQLLQAGRNAIGALQTLDEYKAAAIRIMKLYAGDAPGEAILKIVEEYAAKISAAASADEADQLLTAADAAIRAERKNGELQSVSLNKTQKTLYQRKDKNRRDTLQLKVSVTPSAARYDSVTWKSSKPKVAEVDENGLVTALKKGTAIITATVRNGDQEWTASCAVTVKKLDKKVTGITAKPKKLTLKKGEKTTVDLTFKPKGVYNNQVKWSTSNKKVATVSKTGVITAKGKGKCNITAAATDGSGKKVTVKVTVK